jgi:hypothetical protein
MRLEMEERRVQYGRELGIRERGSKVYFILAK